MLGSRMSEQRIDSDRLKRDFDLLAEIGSTGDGGVHRPALSDAHLEARRWFRERIETDGFDFHVDGAGNHSARLPCASPGAPTLLLGSHLDSVPNGGRFDGALGVLTALEVLRAVRDTGTSLPVHLEAIDFTDEEGSLVGLLGSRAIAGVLDPAEFAGDDRRSLRDALARGGLSPEGVVTARREAGSLAGFLEVHIEQGPRLRETRVSIGIVTSIAGIASGILVLTGRADHAGTTPMGARRDAGLGAATLITRAAARVKRDFPGCVINFGRVGFSPGAYNIVPGGAELAVEFRAGDAETLAQLETTLTDLFGEAARHHGLEMDFRPRATLPPAPCATEVQAAFGAACEHLDLRHVSLASGAGHDTGIVATVCPAGMILIPSTGGSHSPREFAEWDDCVNGANVMLVAALRLAERVGDVDAG
ncbi:MAG: Zn-dependent hydrolase [Acidobacteriota bacterium]|nr:Zn-dependent hydrolase [Acidobacteriota bacterium]